MIKHSQQSGYVGIISVMIISLITLTLAAAISLSGLNEILFGYSLSQSHRVLQEADGCAEEAYYRLKLDPAYSGGTIPYNGGTCLISISGAGSARTITATASSGGASRTVTSGIQLESNASVTTEGVGLDSWTE